jgi:peptidoglycan/LPS O-acetylase OafA/YrhL
MDALTGLRAFAALAIVFFHLRISGFVPPGYVAALPAVTSFYLGVDLFFLLSGFVLMHVHGGEFRHIAAGPVRRFYALRLARIYPVHVTVLALLVVVVAAQLLLAPAAARMPQFEKRFGVEALVSHLLLVGWSSPTWNQPAWSLSAEWTAYLAFPLLPCVLSRMSPGRALGLLALLAAGFTWVYAGPFDYVLDRHGLVRVAFEFPIGCLLYRLARSLPARVALPLLLAAAGLVVALYGTRWGDLAVVPALAVLVLACGSPNVLSRALSARWLVWLGEISYSIYMLHVVVLGFAGRAAPLVLRIVPAGGRPAMMALALAAVVGCAAALHYTVERPARQYLRRRIDERSGRLAEAPAAPATA